MKVCHLTSVHPTFDTRIFLKECVSLARAGFDVSLVSNHARHERVQGVELIAVKGKRGGRLYRMLVYTWRILFAGLRTRARIYHFHDPELFFAGVVLRCLGKTVIYDVHENVSAQIKTKDWLPLPGVASRLYRVIDALSAKLFYLVLAEDSYASLYRRFKPRGAIVLNMPDLVYLEPYVTPDRSRNGGEVFYVGDVTNQRGMDVVVEALALLKKRGIACVYHCVGPFSERMMDELKETRSYREVQGSIRMYGTLGLAQAYGVSTRCKAGLCLLKPIPNYESSYSTKIFEYMAVQLPVIASNFGLFRRVVEQSACGVSVDPRDPAAVADAIERVLGDDGAAQAMGRNGRKAVLERYSWDAEREKLVRFYRGVAAGRRERL